MEFVKSGVSIKNASSSQLRELVEQAVVELEANSGDRVLFDMAEDGSYRYERVKAELPGAYSLDGLKSWQMRHQ